jgi:hypothetical protein
MASLVKQFSGRKRESIVHKHFRYDLDINKSICLVSKGSDNGICGFRVAGKNTTNLKSHLQHHHSEIYNEIKRTEELTAGSEPETKKRKVSEG